MINNKTNITLYVFLTAVQHERAPRPGLATQHQIALQKLGYNFNRQPNIYPTSSSLGFPTFPTLHPYGVLSAAPSDFPTNIHKNFLENSPFQNIPHSRIADSMSTDFPHLNPLLASQVGNLSELTPFKIPLFPSSLHYPTPHPGYFPTSLFYPPVAPLELTTSLDNSRGKYEILFA